MIYNFLTDETFETPANEKDLQIIHDFIDFLPTDFNVVTINDVMNKLNSANTEVNTMFTEDYTTNDYNDDQSDDTNEEN